MSKRHTQASWRTSATWLLASLAAGCGFGLAASAPWISNADDNDVVFIGDSIFALSGEIQDRLHDLNAGTFRNYTTSGAEIVGGLLAPSIEQQFDISLSDGGGSTIVVMDGGGNDILIPVIALFDPYDCKTSWWESGLSSSCRDYIDDVYLDIVDVLDGLDAEGIDEVIYLGYYPTLDGELDEAVDYGNQVIERACTVSQVDCTFLDPTGLVLDADIVADGIHPATSGSDKLADLIWAELSPLL